MTTRRTTPALGDQVHYMAHGSADGTYPRACRAATVTQVHDDADTLGLAVLNPTGAFFNPSVPHDEDTKIGGTWHWPEIHPQ